MSTRDGSGRALDTYDSLDRLATRTDPVGAVETFKYDGMGNLTGQVDRKGQQALFNYDALSRRIGRSYPEQVMTGRFFTVLDIKSCVVKQISGGR